jgi:hypothetical protein
VTVDSDRVGHRTAPDKKRNSPRKPTPRENRGRSGIAPIPAAAVGANPVTQHWSIGENVL